MADIVNKGPNFATAEFKRNVVELVNASGLPCCITRMVLAELVEEIRQIEQGAIQQEGNDWLLARQKEQEAQVKAEEGQKE